MFSVPLNPKLGEEDLAVFAQFLEQRKAYLYDFYFTCRIPPFTQDAMGDVFPQMYSDQLIDKAIILQEDTGVPASAVFNNIEVRPSEENLDLFIENYRPIYELGIRSITIPHTHWVATGKIQQAFPDIFIKNTILRKVNEPREIEHLAKAGFNYINLDRALMRDEQRLLRFKKAKEKYGIKLSILANEGCVGGCIMMDEHYHFNNTRTDGPAYFADPISRVSCTKWNKEDSALFLKVANLPPWKEDWDRMFELGVDVIKMHGRESIPQLWETVDIINRYVEGQEILRREFQWSVIRAGLSDKAISIWREKIRTCNFDCWDCGFCDKIIAHQEKDM